MSTVDTDVIDAFQSLGVDRERAMKAAIAIYHREDAIGAGVISDIAALKTDISVLKTDLGDLKVQIRTLSVDVDKLKADAAVLKWMAGFNMALTFAVFLKLFLR